MELLWAPKRDTETSRHEPFPVWPSFCHCFRQFSCKYWNTVLLMTMEQNWGHERRFNVIISNQPYLLSFPVSRRTEKNSWVGTYQGHQYPGWCYGCLKYCFLWRDKCFLTLYLQWVFVVSGWGNRFFNHWRMGLESTENTIQQTCQLSRVFQISGIANLQHWVF